MSTKAKPFVTLTLIAVVVFFASVSVPQGQKAEQKMRYLVTGEYIDPGPMLSPQQGIQIFEQTILPSLEALVKLEAEGKILAGGILVGDRAGVMIVEVDSNAALDQLFAFLGAVEVGNHPTDHRCGSAGLRSSSS